jgi:hypothetical protein
MVTAAEASDVADLGLDEEGARGPALWQLRICPVIISVAGTMYESGMPACALRRAFINKDIIARQLPNLKVAHA